MSSVFQLPQPTGQGTTLRGGSVVQWFTGQMTRMGHNPQHREQLSWPDDNNYCSHLTVICTERPFLPKPSAIHYRL